MAQILTILFLLQLSLFAEFKVKSFLEIKYIDVVKNALENYDEDLAQFNFANSYRNKIDRFCIQ